MKKVAVVGTGAAGLGVLSSLITKKDIEIVVFEIGKPLEKQIVNLKTKKEISNFYSSIYQKIRKTQKLKFPPPKTNFANTLPKYKVDGKEKIFKSENFGGLTNFWGGTALPFTENEFKNWHISYDEMKPYYEKIAQITGISGAKDELNSYFKEDFVNKPPIKITSAFQKLNSIIKNTSTLENYTVFSGVNRCMIETRESEKRTCVACGECLAGCFKDSIYCSFHTLEEYLKHENVTTIKAKVSKVDEKGTVEAILDGKMTQFSGFDMIYLAAGCPNTTEIVMRSTGIHQVEPMQDNAVYVFPIFNFNFDAIKNYNEDYLSINNLIVGLIPKNETDKFAQALVYNNFDYMWRYNIPNGLWRLISWKFKLLRNKIFWARLYVHGNYSQAYNIELKNNELNFSNAQNADKKVIQGMMKSLRKALNKKGFWIPPISPLLQKSNSHYSSTLPYNGTKINIDEKSQVMDNVFVCDSSVFPELPAVSLTFTIMANAARIADKSFD